MARASSAEMRIALIGVCGALGGALVGGLVTWRVTQDQLSTQRADARRTERLQAYAQYFGDAARLWTEAIDAAEVTPRPVNLPRTQAAALTDLEETLTREYALVALVAPSSVRDIARELNAADTELGNALLSTPVDYRLYRKTVAKAAHGPDNLLARFAAAAKRDIGT